MSIHDESTGERAHGTRWFRRWPVRVLAILVGLAAVSGAALGTFMRLDLPDVRALEDYSPPLMTRVLANDGTLLDTFAEQRRILIEYADIPTVFREALLAAEDSNFMRHTGIDPRGIARAAWRDLTSLRLAEGASTVTQQLARNLFLHPDKTLKRKLQEAVLALEIERSYTKEEILTFYCNQIYMGHGRYGLEAAARFYFDAPARELTLPQAAMLAGLIQRPESLTPLRHPQRAFDRRNYVLRRMVEEGFISGELAAELQPLPVELARSGRSVLAPYFVEEVRRWLQQRHGSTNLYREGMMVRTTVDLRLQEAANRAVEQGLRELDKRQGWRGVSARLAADADPNVTQLPGWENEPAVGQVHDAIVVRLDPQRARVRLGPYTGILDAPAVAWTGSSDPRGLFAVGDIVRVRLAALDGAAATLELEQEPLAEAALVALDPATGAVRALVGGFRFERSEFNRAIQARRQTGSAFKPFVYAAALASGWTLADTLLDEPTVFLDPQLPEPYQPENFSNHYYETVTLRTSLEKSANIATVKLLDAIGYRPVIELAHRLGISAELLPYPSLALGSFEATLLELTAAYGTLANQGVYVEPHLVEEVLDREDRPVEQIEPEVRDAVSPQIAYLMNRLLSGVITDGTGRGAASLHLNLAGKTGTTDNNTDAWFIGYAPNLAVGVWLGFDEPASLGKREAGAVAALPIWRAFMEEAFAALPNPSFVEPPGLTLVSIDRNTGLRANPQAYCQHVLTEVFVSGTEPTRTCSVDEHQRLRLPYRFQRYPLNEQGELPIPADELETLLASEPEVWTADRGRRLEARRRVADGLREETVSVPLRILPAAEPSAGPGTARLPPFETGSWRGSDGRPARIVWLSARR